MNEFYEFEGITYEVAPHRLEEFLKQHEGAIKVDGPGKTASLTGGPTLSQDATGSILEDGFLALPEAKDSKEIVRNLPLIDDAVTYDKDPTLKENILNSFFNTDNLFRPVDIDETQTPVTFSGVDRPGYGIHSNITIQGVDSEYKNTEEEDLINYFGEDKYNLYKKYLETGDLKIEDIPENLADGFNKIKNEETARRSSYLKDLYLKQNEHIDVDDSFFNAVSMDEDERGLYSTDFISSYSEQEDLAEELTGHSMKNVFQLQKQKKSVAEKTVKMQNKYLTDLSTVLEEDNPNIDINTRKEVLEKNRAISKRLNDFKTMANKFNDRVSALSALDKSYDWGYRVGLSIERDIFGQLVGAGKAVTALGAEKILGKDSEISKYLKEGYVSHINYQESLNQKKEANLPQDTKFANIEDWDSFGDFVGEQIGNNILSVSTAGAYGLAVKTGSKQAAKWAGRAVLGTFFGVEGMGKVSEMEIAQKHAAKNIKFIEEALADENTTPDVRMRLEEQRDFNEKALNYSQAERAFMGITYGGIAALAERMGTMRWIEDLYGVSKTVGPLTIKSGLHSAKNFIIKVPGTELLEETATQVGHNLMDVLILKEDKSLIESKEKYGRDMLSLALLEKTISLYQENQKD
jgi:hypothetical protein